MVDLGDGAGDRRGVPQPAADEAQAAQDPNICSGSFPAPIFKVVVFPFFLTKPVVRFSNFLSMKHLLLLITFSLRWSKELWLARYRHNN